MTLLWLEQTASTNTWLKENAGKVAPKTMVMAHKQTAGRGQRGNSWESEPGKNLTFSFYFAPEGLLPAEQFAVSEAVSLAMVKALAHFGVEAEVKWPNDIYVGDKKIAGILIENSIMGNSISRCIIGIGLNVNQKEFHSDAPNPVSMGILTGKEYVLEEVATEVGEAMESYLKLIGNNEKLHKEYMKKLWRRDGAHPFRDKADAAVFMGEIEDVESGGHLVIKETNTGEKRRYAFKEVEFLLTDRYCRIQK